MLNIRLSSFLRDLNSLFLSSLFTLSPLHSQLPSSHCQILLYTLEILAMFIPGFRHAWPCQDVHCGRPLRALFA